MQCNKTKINFTHTYARTFVLSYDYISLIFHILSNISISLSPIHLFIFDMRCIIICCFFFICFFFYLLFLFLYFHYFVIVFVFLCSHEMPRNVMSLQLIWYSSLKCVFRYEIEWNDIELELEFLIHGIIFRRKCSIFYLILEFFFLIYSP